jgi:hypothetical protein
MIRIDELYSNTIWPWLAQHRPGVRLFFCDPPGRTDPDALFNLGSDTITENNYVFMHDQEPVHMDLHRPLFEEVVLRNHDITNYHRSDRDLAFPDPTVQAAYDRLIDVQDQDLDVFLREHQDIFDQVLQLNPGVFQQGHVIVSEQGEHVAAMARKYGWTTHYYFYHGWSCLDWFRGYDKTFLIARSRDRAPTQTFMSPNRIVGGKRDHRVLFLYNIYQRQLEHNHISAPRTCPYEGVDIASIAQKYTNVYPDIVQVLEQANLPRTFAGEATQEMTSCWLGNWAEAADSLVYVATETVYFGRRQHLTEKTFKAIALEMPFVLVAPAGSLAYLREYGFRTFDTVWDESYDAETDDVVRIERVAELLADLEAQGPEARLRLHAQCREIVEHNYNHFYGGAFAQILWSELTAMLEGIGV